jgi:hypothetical protein
MSQSGLGMEAEEIGMVALIGVILVPGFMWIANAKGAGSKLLRMVAVGSLVTAAAMLELSVDKTVNSASDLLGGDVS